ncbi:myosin-2, partial [Aureobasidium sp. EXF-3399]
LTDETGGEVRGKGGGSGLLKFGPVRCRSADRWSLLSIKRDAVDEFVVRRQTEKSVVGGPRRRGWRQQICVFLLLAQRTRPLRVLSNESVPTLTQHALSTHTFIVVQRQVLLDFLLMMLMKPILSVQMTPIPHITSLAILTCFVRFLSHGTSSIKLLLHDRLCGNNFCKALESRCLQPRGCVGLECCDDARLGDFVGPAVVHVYGGQEQNIGLGVGDARGDGFHDFAVDGLFVVGDEVLVQQLLNLVGREPGFVVSIRGFLGSSTERCRLLELQKLGGLHKMLKLESTLGHIMALAPFLNSGNVVVDLQTTLPREEVTAHEKVIEGGDTDETKKLGNGLGDDGVLEVECLHSLEDIVEQRKQVVHAKGRCVVGLKKLAEETVALIARKTNESISWTFESQKAPGLTASSPSKRSDSLTKPLFHISEVTRLMRYAGNKTSLSVGSGVDPGRGILRFLIRPMETSSFNASSLASKFSSSISTFSKSGLKVDPERVCWCPLVAPNAIETGRGLKVPLDLSVLVGSKPALRPPPLVISPCCLNDIFSVSDTVTLCFEFSSSSVVTRRDSRSVLSSSWSLRILDEDSS